MKFLRLFAGVRHLEEDVQVLSVRLGEAQYFLQLEIAKRIAAENLAVSRGAEIEWLRGELAKTQESRDAAVTARLQSLDLVNAALLKAKEPEANPTPEQLKQFSPIQIKNDPATKLIRQATHRLIDGLQERDRKKKAPLPDKAS